MKSVSLFSAVFVLCISCVCWSCSSDDLVVESQNSNNEVVMQNDSVKMAELILFINETAPQYSSYVNTANSRSLRSFFRWLRDVLKCDALGYLWGLGRGFGFQGSLIPGVACSVVGAVSLQSANGISQNDWKISSDWAVYSSPTYDYQKIGYDHNKSIYNMNRNNPRLFNGSTSEILSATKSSLAGLGYSSGSLSVTDFNILTVPLSQSYSSFESIVLSSLRNNSSYNQFGAVVINYAEQVVNLTDKSQVKDYTISINNQIDRMGLARAKELKAAIAICESSRFLWEER